MEDWLLLESLLVRTANSDQVAEPGPELEADTLSSRCVSPCIKAGRVSRGVQMGIRDFRDRAKEAWR